MRLSGAGSSLLRGICGVTASVAVLLALGAVPAESQRQPPPPPKPTKPGDLGACRHIKCTPRQEFIAAAGYQPARDLRRSLGRPPADRDGSRNGFVAHHIIPIDNFEGYGVYLQEWGAWCRVPPNSRANGVYLRGPSRRAGKGAYEALSPFGKKRMYFQRARGATYRTTIGKRMAKGKAVPETGKCSPELRTRFLRVLAGVKADLINGSLRVD